jgi:hypothetical protein
VDCQLLPYLLGLRGHGRSSPNNSLWWREPEVGEGGRGGVEAFGWGSYCWGSDHFSFVVDDKVDAPEADGCPGGSGGIMVDHSEPRGEDHRECAKAPT